MLGFRFRDVRVLGFRDLGVFGFRDLSVSGFRDLRVLGFRESKSVGVGFRTKSFGIQELQSRHQVNAERFGSAS